MTDGSGLVNAAAVERQMAVRRNMLRATALALLLAGTAPARADDGYRLWLRADAPAAPSARVTLRGARMYEFLDRLTSIALPRIRDFRGLDPGSFDGSGNYSIGIREQIIFPEIDYDKVDAVRGMDIVFVTTAKTDKEAKALLKAFQFPFSN